eukprot:Nk52_evm14s238 gene=Nk52_evmTU14s238
MRGSGSAVVFGGLVWRGLQRSLLQRRLMGVFVRGCSSSAGGLKEGHDHNPNREGPRAVLDYSFIRANRELLERELTNRKLRLPSLGGAGGEAGASGNGEILDWVVCRSEELEELARKTQKMRASRNSINAQLKDMAKRLQSGAASKEELAELSKEGKSLREEIKQAEDVLLNGQLEVLSVAKHIPNVSHVDVPVGEEENATLLYEKGAKVTGETAGHALETYEEIGKRLDMFDFEAGARISGPKFVFLKKDAALLEMALINYAMQKAMTRGFVPLSGPDVCKHFVFEACGFQPRGPHSQVYNIEKKNPSDQAMCLVGTAEIPLAGLNMEKSLSRAEMPLKYVMFGRCFRAEAGGYGIQEKSLYRVHQFSKVELFGISPGSADENGTFDSEHLHREMLDFEIELYEELGLHFRVLDMPTAELGSPAFRKYDIEAYLPGRGDYGEISSTSNCLDYQSRRLSIRCDSDGTKTRAKQFVHTVNGTAAAIPRLIIAILETHQQADGTVLIPKALQPFLGKERFA